MSANTKATARTEKQVLQQVLEALRVFGVDVQRQNTGAGVNPSGKTIRFGEPGDADIRGVLPGGRVLQIEVKREGFNPNRLRGEKREHFERQLARLQKTNALGGVAFWCDDAKELAEVILPLVLEGAAVEEPGFGPLRIIRK